MVSIKHLLDVVHVGLDFDSDRRIAEAIKFINTVQQLDPSAKEVLKGCFEQGPLHDGDVPSKTGRDELLNLGFVAKVTVKSEEGFNACTYLGARAYRLIKEGL